MAVQAVCNTAALRGEWFDSTGLHWKVCRVSA
jgi:hypothetical protein